MTKIKKVSQPVYLTPLQREFIKTMANEEGITMNAFIVNLINASMKKK